MRYAVQLEKGNPVLTDIAQKTKDEMTDFVSFYRRFGGISGKQSFSLLYTSINVLAGHYTRLAMNTTTTLTHDLNSTHHVAYMHEQLWS